MSGFPQFIAATVNGSLWQEPAATRVVWMTMMAFAEKSSGLVRMNVVNISKLSNVTMKETCEALRCLSSPSPESRSDPKDSGKLIARHADGWQMLNWKIQGHDLTEEEERVRRNAKQREWRHRNTYGIVRPKDPELLAEEDIKVIEMLTPKSSIAKRISTLMKRRLSTPWTEKEIRAFKEIGFVEDEDMIYLEIYYDRERRKGDKGHHRRDMKTFLNNFRGEVDRAKGATPRWKIEKRIQEINGTKIVPFQPHEEKVSEEEQHQIYSEYEQQKAATFGNNGTHATS